MISWVSHSAKLRALHPLVLASSPGTSPGAVGQRCIRSWDSWDLEFFMRNSWVMWVMLSEKSWLETLSLNFLFLESVAVSCIQYGTTANLVFRRSHSPDSPPVSLHIGSYLITNGGFFHVKIIGKYRHDIFVNEAFRRVAHRGTPDQSSHVWRESITWWFQTI